MADSLGEYERLLSKVMKEGVAKGDRTGTGTRSIFGHQMRFRMADGFPLITTKRVHFRSVAIELLWMIAGRTDVAWLQERGVTIWDEWQFTDGTIGEGYGAQWRSWPYHSDGRYIEDIDQLAEVVEEIKRNPDSRRLIVSAWNVGEIEAMALPPCHMMFQFYVVNGELSVQVYQRSADLFLGVPFNIASYALMLHMVAQQTGLEPGELIWTGGDCHIYDDHVDQVREQLSRKIRPFPQLKLDKAADLFSYEYDNIRLIGYDPHPPIKADVSV